MKNNIGYIFVDDGYPEAEEYETNYIRYNTADPASFSRAFDCANHTKVGSRLSDTLTFRNIPLDSDRGQQLLRRARRNRRTSRMGRIRNTLTRLVKS